MKNIIKVTVKIYAGEVKGIEEKYFAIPSNAVIYATSCTYCDLYFSEDKFVQTMFQLREKWMKSIEEITCQEAIERLDEESYRRPAGKLFDVYVRFDAIDIVDSK